MREVQPNDEQITLVTRAGSALAQRLREELKVAVCESADIPRFLDAASPGIYLLDATGTAFDIEQSIISLRVASATIGIVAIIAEGAEHQTNTYLAAGADEVLQAQQLCARDWPAISARVKARISGRSRSSLDFDALPLMVLRLSAEGFPTRANRRAREFMDAHLPGVPESGFVDSLAAVGDRRVRRAFDQALSSTDGDSTVELFVDQGAEGFWLRAHFFALGHHQNKQVHVIMRDTTRERATLEALADSEKRFARTLDVIPASVIISDLESAQVLVANAGFETLWRIPREEIIGKSIRENAWVYPEQRDEFVRLLNEDGEVRNFRATLNPEGSGAKTCFLYGATIDYDGHRSVLSIAVDISDLQRSMQALEASENRNAELLRVTEVVPWEQDISTGAVIEIAQSIEQLLGYDARHWREPGFWESKIHPQDRDEVLREFNQKISRGQSFELDYRMIHSDERIVWVHDKISITESQEGRRLRGIRFDSTRTKEAESELRRAHRQLWHHISNTPLAVIEWDSNFHVLHWSERAGKLFGWNAEEVIGKQFSAWEIVHEDDVNEVRRSLEKLFSQGADSTLTRNRTKSGELIDCEWYNSVIYDENGKVLSILSQVLDISERMNALRHIEQQRQYINQIINAVPNLIYVKDEEGRFRFVNEALARFLDCSIEDLLGNRIGDFLPRGDPQIERIRANDLDVLARQAQVYFPEEYFVDLNGKGHWLKTTKLPVRDPNDAIQVLGVSVDVTDLKFATLLLGIERAFLTSLSQSATIEASFSILVEGIKSVLQTPEVAAFFLSPDDELLVAECEQESGSLADYLLEPSDTQQVRICVKTHLRDCLDQQLLASESVSVINASGQAESMWLWGVRGHAGELLGAVALFSARGWEPDERVDDVMLRLSILAGLAVDQAQASAELRQYQKNLEAKVRERTQQIAVANEELKAFAYSVSHDLRTPLRGIDGFAQALKEDCGADLNDLGRDYIARIRRASQRLGLMIDDLLQYSSVARAQMVSTEVDLSELAEEILREFAEREPQRKVHLELASGLCACGDEQMLRVLLENLLGNAWKFTGDTELARIEFGCNDNGGVREYFVRDNGVGFDMQYADQLFAPFQRLHRADVFEGSGIGLASAARIVSRHGGAIRGVSTPGEGACLYFTLASTNTSATADGEQAWRLLERA